MTDKQTGARAAAEEIDLQYATWGQERANKGYHILPFANERLDIVEAIILKHCPQDKAVGLVEALKDISDFPRYAGAILSVEAGKSAIIALAQKAATALDDHERAQSSDVMDFGICPGCDNPLTSEEHDRSERYGGKCYNCFEDYAN